jgi:hypothetical protein
MPKDAAPAYTNAQVWNLVCLLCLIELKQQPENKTAVLETWLAAHAPAHIAQFLEGTGFYEHPACVALREQHTFTAANLATSKQLNGKAILEKARATERAIRNELVPVVYQCLDSLELRSNSYTFKSGKGPKEFELELKRRLWVLSGKPEGAFEGTESLSKYHAYYLAFVCTTVASYYIYDVDGLPVYKDLIQPSSATTDDASGRGKGRIAQRAAAKKPRLSETSGAASFESKSTASSAASAYARNKEREQALAFMNIVISNGTPEQKAQAVATAQEMLAQIAQDTKKPQAPTPPLRREAPSSETPSLAGADEDSDVDG